MRKTPRLPPPRATTPRHTNIGSPKRMSSARPQSQNAMARDISPNRALSQPPANRILNFGRQNVRADTGSPFKPTKVLRRSFGGVKDQFEEEEQVSSPGSDIKPELPTIEAETFEDDDTDDAGDYETGAGAEVYSDEPQDETRHHQDDQTVDDTPPMFIDEDDYTQGDAEEPDITQALEHAELLLQTTPTAASSIRKPRGRPRKSVDTTEASILEQTSASQQTDSNGRKRTRAEVENDQGADETLESIEQTQNDTTQDSAKSENPAKRPRGRPRKNQVTVLQDLIERSALEADQTLQSVQLGDEPSQISTTAAPNGSVKKGRGRSRKSDVIIVHENTEQTVDPADIAYGDSYLAPIDEVGEFEAAPASPTAKSKPEKKTKVTKATKSLKTPKERDPNQAMRRTPSGSPGKIDRTLGLSPSKRGGSISNVNLRASTPFEDAHQRMSRSGRPIMAPLKHWAGESYVWKNGEVEGIIRADEVKTPRGNKKKVSKSKRRVARGRGGNSLDIIAEESDTESTVPDDWEEQVGVIAGTVAAWDPDAQQGNPEVPIREGMWHLPVNSDLNTDLRRYCIRIIIYCDPRRGWIGLPICQNHDASFLRLRNRRAAARRFQTREKLPQDANGLLCPRR
jgi:centromere protein C